MQKLSFQEIILKLLNFWSKQGCTILQPYDMEVGAGTFHPATALHVLGPNPLFPTPCPERYLQNDKANLHGQNKLRQDLHLCCHIVLKLHLFFGRLN